MDIEHFTHRGYKPSLLIAMVLSAMIVTLASLLARGTLNIRGALYQTAEKPMNTAVILLVEKSLEDGEHIDNLEFLRSEPLKSGDTSKDPKAQQHSYYVHTTNQHDFLAQLFFNPDSKLWSVRTLERLHGDNDLTALAAENE